MPGMLAGLLSYYFECFLDFGWYKNLDFHTIA
jgi:hypothetical protein